MHPYKEKNGNNLCLLHKMYAKVQRLESFKELTRKSISNSTVKNKKALGLAAF